MQRTPTQDQGWPSGTCADPCCHPRPPRTSRAGRHQACTFLPRVCLNRHGDTVLSPICELQSLQQELYFRVTVGTDHIEGISRLVGKIRFLEKSRHEIKKCHELRVLAVGQPTKFFLYEHLNIQIHFWQLELFCF